MGENDQSTADPFGLIADEFVVAFRQGKRPRWFRMRMMGAQGDLRVGGFRFVGYRPRRLADNLNDPDQGMLVQPALLKFFPGQTRTQLQGLAGRQQHVEQIRRVTLHR